MNPGGNSLKVEIVSCSPTQQLASEGKKLVSLILEGIGKTRFLSVLDGIGENTTTSAGAGLHVLPLVWTGNGRRKESDPH
jgi:hypothetical protein